MTLHMTDVSDNVSVSTIPITSETTAPEIRWYRTFFKRAFDFAIVLTAAIVWLPVVAVLAFLVSLDGSSPFFVQRRVGRDGVIFWMIKLRTMVPNADEALKAYLAENPQAKAEWDRDQKLRKDPRITRLGHVLRATSMDELPQLINVLKGDMSLVGPRPFMECQKSLYPGLGYYRVRPGITGLWQVSDRNNTTFAYRAVFDDDYERSLSLKGDIMILKRTFGAVLGCTGI